MASVVRTIDSRGAAGGPAPLFKDLEADRRRAARQRRQRIGGSDGLDDPPGERLVEADASDQLRRPRRRTGDRHNQLFQRGADRSPTCWHALGDRATTPRRSIRGGECILGHAEDWSRDQEVSTTTGIFVRGLIIPGSSFSKILPRILSENLTPPEQMVLSFSRSTTVCVIRLARLIQPLESIVLTRLRPSTTPGRADSTTTIAGGIMNRSVVAPITILALAAVLGGQADQAVAQCTPGWQAGTELRHERARPLAPDVGPGRRRSSGAGACRGR